MSAASPEGGAAAMAPLGLIAGAGALPRRLIAACRRRGRPVVVAALLGHCEPATVEGLPHRWLRPGAAGALFGWLKEAGAREICMAGQVTRPSLTQLRPDWRALRFIARNGFRALGDNALLEAIRREMEAEGFTIVAPEAVLDELPAPAGLLTRARPNAVHEADIARGLEVARASGLLDIGQAVAVEEGVVLGVEAAEGTDALIERCGPLIRHKPGGVLVKIAKPQQGRSLDPPVIGPETIARAASAGLAGLALETGGVLILDRSVVRAAADAAGLFVIGVDAVAPD